MLMITGALQKTFNTTLDGVIPICSCQRLIINLKRHTLISVIGTQKFCFFLFVFEFLFFFSLLPVQIFEEVFRPFLFIKEISLPRK